MCLLPEDAAGGNLHPPGALMLWLTLHVRTTRCRFTVGRDDYIAAYYCRDRKIGCGM